MRQRCRGRRADALLGAMRVRGRASAVHACQDGSFLQVSERRRPPPRCLSPSACTAAGGTPSSLRHVPDQTSDTPVDGSKGLALPALFRTCTLPPLRTATINIVGLDDPQPPATTAPNTTAATLSQPPQLHSRQGRAATAKRICTESQLPTADVIIMLDTTSSLLSSTGCQTVPQLKIGLKKFVSSLVSHQCITSSSSSLAFSPPPPWALSACLPVCLPAYLSVCLSDGQTVSLSVCLLDSLSHRVWVCVLDTAACGCVIVLISLLVMLRVGMEVSERKGDSLVSFIERWTHSQ